MLHKTNADTACSLEGLKVAATRWIGTNKAFERKQSLAWWCGNLQAFLVVESKQVPIINDPISAAKSDDTGSDDMQWWKGI
jgi:hypothetical protein